MHTEYFRFYSSALGRDMEGTLYGHGGRRVLYIPCQDGRFYDFEHFHMTDTWTPWIDSGQVTVCAVDTLDVETWSNSSGDPRQRICRHEAWMAYLTRELVPFFRDRHPDPRGVTAFGCSLGATHAANLYFRFPDVFDGLLALSGIYTAAYGFGDYMDELVYANSPIHYLGGMPNDHPFIPLYNSHRAVLCVGQGAWEQPDSTRQLGDILRQRGIEAWVDFWGFDVNHDWPWWHRQVQYFLPHLL